MRLRVYILLAILWHCTRTTTTAQLLDLNFLNVAPNVSVKMPDSITDGSDFTATVMLSLEGNPLAIDGGDVDWKATTSGKVVVVSSGGWVKAERRYILRYNNNLFYPATSSQAFSATLSRYSGSFAVTSSIPVQGRYAPASFTVAAPATATQATNFSVTVTAKLGNGAVMTDFNGAVNLTANESSGTLSATNPVSGFVNGQLTVNLSYSVLSSALQIRATNPADYNGTGVSGGIQISSLNPATLSTGFSGWGIKADRNFLQWNKFTGAASYRVSRQLPDTSYVVLGNYGAAVFYAYDTGLTASASYNYKLEVLDAGSALLATGYAAATTLTSTECSTTVAAGTISSIQTWTVAASPYCITGNLIIDAGGQLTIERGSTLLITENMGLTLQNGGTLVMADTGSGQTLVTTRNTASPPLMHNGITFAATATATIFSPGTETYSAGSVIRHLSYMRAQKPLTAAVDLLIYDSYFAQNTSPGASTQAGAVQITGATNAVIQSSLFQQNTGDRGAAVVDVATRASVRDSIFEVNKANSNAGGAAYLKAAASFATGGVFTANSATGDGGALRVDILGASSGTVTNNQFTSNTSSANGGGLSLQAEQYTLDNNTFISNSASSGGGFFSYANANNNHTTSQLNKNVIKNNTATTSGGGVRLLAWGSAGAGFIARMYFRDNIVQNNQASTSGGGIFQDQNAGGGQFRNTLLYAQYNDITGNSAPLGGAIYIKYNLSCPGATNRGDYSYNTISSNTASNQGGAVYATANCNTASLPFGDHNNFSGNAATTAPNSANIYTNNTLISMDATYFSGGMDTTCTGRTAMQLMDSCNSATGTLTVTNPVAALYPTCAVSPANPNCVGKR